MSARNHEERPPRNLRTSLSGIPLQVFATIARRWTKPTTGGTPTPNTPEPRTVVRQAQRLPGEILEMIITHLIYDTSSLKTCAATCFAWYNVATPHLHHTLTLRQWHSETECRNLNPLAVLHERGLLSRVKKLRFRSGFSRNPWVVPEYFDSWGLHYFSALVNLQDLAIAGMDFSKFTSGTKKYFGHSSPTLRSIALIRPTGSPRQLVDFLALFQELDDIKIVCYRATPETHDTPDTPRAPIQGSLRGKLALSGFAVGEMFERMISTFGGIRFISLDLDDVLGAQPLLDACAETLQTLRLDPDGMLHLFSGSSQGFDLSRNTALRSLEVRASPRLREYGTTLKKLLPTITSPVFSEIVVIFSENEVRRLPPGLAKALHEMYKIRKFRVAFCLETIERFEAHNLRLLTSEIEVGALKGSLDFLPCPPSVFSRTLAKYDRLRNP